MPSLKSLMPSHIVCDTVDCRNYKYSVRGQGRPWSNCADAQFDRSFAVPVADAQFDRAFAVPVADAQFDRAFAVPVADAQFDRAFAVPVRSGSLLSAYI